MQSAALGSDDTFYQTFTRLKEDDELYEVACLKIRTKDGRLIPLKRNAAQRLVMERINRQMAEMRRVRAVILKARQEGVSTEVAAHFFHDLNLEAGIKGLVIADEIPRAETLFSIYERFHDNLPHELQPSIKGRSSRRSLWYAHDSEIAIRPASDENAGRAQTLHKLHASEIAFWPESTQREIWRSALSAVPDYGSEVIVESTPNGAGGLFYELWESTEDPRSGWIGIFLPWWIHEEYIAGYGQSEPMMPHETEVIITNPDPLEKQALTDGIPWEGKNWVLPMERLVWRRRTIIGDFGGDPDTLGEDATREFQREYPATVEEAFMASGAMYFDDARVRELSQKTEEPERIGKLVESYTEVEGKKIRTITFQDNARGMVRVFEEPQKQPMDRKAPDGFVMKHYAIGSDTAEGKLVVKSESRESSTKRDDRDYSAGAVITVPKLGEAPKLVATIHGWIPGDIFAKQLSLLGEWYECGGPHDVPPTRRERARLAVENNHSSGQRVLFHLKDVLKYGGKLYYQREFNTRTNQFEKRIGWRTDERSRDLLLDTLGEHIRRSGIIIPDKRTVKELGQFVYGKDGKPGAMEGTHDDSVFALALALQMALKEHRHAVTESTMTWEQISEMNGGE